LHFYFLLNKNLVNIFAINRNVGMIFDYNTTVFHTEKYLDAMLNNYAGFLSDDDLKILDKFCKKIDVSKTIKKEYMKYLSMPLTNDEISHAYKKKILRLFLLLINDHNDYKLLNSSFKLIDKIKIDNEIVSMKSSYEKLLNRLI
jgi:hypothetical protein